MSFFFLEHLHSSSSKLDISSCLKTFLINLLFSHPAVRVRVFCGFSIITKPQFLASPVNIKYTSSQVLASVNATIINRVTVNMLIHMVCTKCFDDKIITNWLTG